MRSIDTAVNRALYLSLIAIAGACVFVSDARAQPAEMRLSLSLSDGRAPAETVYPGSRVTWQIEVRVGGVNGGLAFAVVDLIGDAESDLVLSAGERGPAMDHFDLPLGLSNIKADGSSAFGGSPDADGLALREIGGAQNTFGAPGPPGVLAASSPQAGVGVGTWVELARGELLAPSDEGASTIGLRDAMVNIMRRALPSPVTVGTVSLDRQSTVLPVPVFLSEPVTLGVSASAMCSAIDYAEPKGVISQTDVEAFVARFFANDPAVARFAEPFDVVSQSDISSFVDMFYEGCAVPNADPPDFGALSLSSSFGGDGMLLAEESGVAVSVPNAMVEFLSEQLQSTNDLSERAAIEELIVFFERMPSQSR
ncbi:MAG: hypothetical protein AAFR38_07365 [Planctomycetota bacterium]